jgi:ribosomal protein S14
VKYALEKDRLRRRIFFRRELSSLGFRALLRSQLVASAPRLRLYPAWGGRLRALPGRIRRRCFLTARSGSPLARFAVSRLSFRSLANGGLLVGVVRSSWLDDGF